jgi:hypothetical protein
MKVLFIFGSVVTVNPRRPIAVRCESWQFLPSRVCCAWTRSTRRSPYRDYHLQLRENFNITSHPCHHDRHSPRRYHYNSTCLPSGSGYPGAYSLNVEWTVLPPLSIMHTTSTSTLSTRVSRNKCCQIAQHTFCSLDRIWDATILRLKMQLGKRAGSP